MLIKMETAGGGGNSTVKSGTFEISAANEIKTIDTGLGKKPSYLWIIGISTNYSATSNKTTASLWFSDMGDNFRWVANATTNNIQAFTTTTTDVNKITAINNDGTFAFKASGTAQTAVGTYYWYAE